MLPPVIFSALMIVGDLLVNGGGIFLHINFFLHHCRKLVITDQGVACVERATVHNMSNNKGNPL